MGPDSGWRPEAVTQPSWAPLPKGAIDIYSANGGELQAFRPRLPRFAGCDLELYALPLALADESLRRSVEVVLHAAWGLDPEAQLSISHLLGLQLNGMSLRSGKRTSRCEANSNSRKEGHWLVWEEAARPAGPPAKDARAVGALVLRRQGPGGAGGIVIDYVAAQRDRGGRGWPMVRAAEVICRQEGLGTLYSAADLSQDGCAPGCAGGSTCCCTGKSAVDAHLRWEFCHSSPEEWKAVGLELYDERRCRVSYMKKSLAPVTAGPAPCHQ